MSSAREAILNAVREAGWSEPARPQAARPRPRDLPRLATFSERLGDLGAAVEIAGRPGDVVERYCDQHGIDSLVHASALPTEWQSTLPAGVAEPDIAPDRRAEIDGAVSGCALAIAETGTIVLDAGPAQGPRWVSLLPDWLFCVLSADQIVATVDEAISILEPRPGEPPPPLTLISGPSATSDIELVRVQGVHGPRHLVVIVVGA
jgi:L-lactate dehydrogenase complex protein LldG